MHAAAAELEGYLRPGEKLLWAGRPDPAKHFTKADVLLIPFSLLWGGFAIFWESAAIAEGPPFFVLWGIPFVLAGLYFIAGRFVWKARQKRRTVYGVTPARAIVVVGRSLTDVPLATTPMTFDLSRDGRHVSVTFGSTAAPAPWGMGGARAMANTGWPMAGGLTGFYDVGDPTGLRSALDEAARRRM